MALYLRMMLYLLGGFLAGQGLAIYDAEAGTITFHVESLATALSGVALHVGTFVVSRIAKSRGGAT